MKASWSHIFKHQNQKRDEKEQRGMAERESIYERQV